LQYDAKYHHDVGDSPGDARQDDGPLECLHWYGNAPGDARNRCGSDCLPHPTGYRGQRAARALAPRTCPGADATGLATSASTSPHDGLNGAGTRVNGPARGMSLGMPGDGATDSVAIFLLSICPTLG